MSMCFKYTALVYLLAVSLVSAVKNESQKKQEYLMSTSTEPPLMTSTIAPPTTPRPMLENVPPQFMEEIQSPIKGAMSTMKPIQVTGFITASGTVYEVEDKSGIGQIEARENGQLLTPQAGEFICNYGTVVVYSDTPCDKVAEQKQSKPIKTETAHIKDQKQSSDVSEQAQADENYENDGQENRKEKKPLSKQKNKKQKQVNGVQNVPKKVILKTRTKIKNRNPSRRQQTKQRRQPQAQYAPIRRPQNNHRRSQNKQKQRNRRPYFNRQSPIQNKLYQQREQYVISNGQIFAISEPSA